MAFFRRPTSSSVFPIQSGRFGAVREEAAGSLVDEAGLFADPGARANVRVGLALPRRRIRLGIGLLAAFFLLFLGRAAQLQVVEGDRYRAQAEGNRFRTTVLPAERGIVTDRYGAILIENVPSFTLTLVPSDLPSERAERDRVIERAALLAGVNRADIDLALQNELRRGEAVAIKRGLPYETAIRLGVEVAALPGFAVEAATTRAYDTSARSLSHALGYVGNISPEELAARREDGYRPVDIIGKSGIERSAETALRGKPGSLVAEVDALGSSIGLVSKTDPESGARLTLAIDLDLQKAAEAALADALAKNRLEAGVAIAIDPQTGAIRALVSLPAYDSNAFAGGVDAETYTALANDPALPLFSRAVAGAYPAGSIFKPFVAYAALHEGLIRASTSFVSSGGLSVGGSFFPDWRAGGHGVTDVRKALADSVNTFFYIIGGGYNDFTGLGVDRITAYARQFGFGARTGVDLPGEAPGFLPSREWKLETKGERWYVGDTYNLSIGQGDLIVTPIQMAAATAAIANGGARIVPHLVEAVDGTPVDYVPEEPSAYDAEDVQIVREGMRQAATLGSARFLATLPEPVAGKTGTAQVSRNRPTHAWFTGFGPYEDPTLAVAVLLEYGGEGSAVAVPVAGEIFRAWFAGGGE